MHVQTGGFSEPDFPHLLRFPARHVWEILRTNLSSFYWRVLHGKTTFASVGFTF